MVVGSLLPTLQCATSDMFARASSRAHPLPRPARSLPDAPPPRAQGAAPRLAAAARRSPAPPFFAARTARVRTGCGARARDPPAPLPAPLADHAAPFTQPHHLKPTAPQRIRTTEGDLAARSIREADQITKPIFRAPWKPLRCVPCHAARLLLSPRPALRPASCCLVPGLRLASSVCFALCTRSALITR